MSVFIIKVERKPGQEAEWRLSWALWRLSLRMSCPGGSSLSCWITALLHLWRWVLVWCNCSTTGPRLPQVWYVRNQLNNCSAMCCLGFAKSHHDPESLSHLGGLPKAYQPVLEKWVLRVSGDRGVCRCWGRVGILQLQGRHPFPSWGFLKDLICCVALSLSQTLLLFRCPSHALSFLFSYLFFPLLLSSLHFSPLLFIISSLLCTSVFLLSLFFWPITIFGVDHVGLRDGLRCGICRKMNCSWIRRRTKTAVPANLRVRLCDQSPGLQKGYLQEPFSDRLLQIKAISLPPREPLGAPHWELRHQIYFLLNITYCLQTTPSRPWIHSAPGQVNSSGGRRFKGEIPIIFASKHLLLKDLVSKQSNDFFF